LADFAVSDIDGEMKQLILRCAVMSSLLIGVSLAYGEMPAMHVTVSDSSGKSAFKGATDSKGNFTTSNLKSGNYIVQLSATSAPAKDSRYGIVVGSGTKRVTANALPGTKFTGGGVALKIQVGPGSNITGQVSDESSGLVNKDGKKMVWIPPQLGSNRPGHWAEEGSAEAVSAKTAGNISTKSFGDLQQRN
jgi:hypothetical protein